MTTPQPELKALLEELASFPSAQQSAPLEAGLRSGHQSRLRQAQSFNQEISLFESAYLLEDAWADFCRFKDSGDKPRNPKIVADQQRKFDFMRLYWGNRDVLSITKKDIKALLQRYLILYVFHQVLVDQGIVPENKHGERKLSIVCDIRL